MKELKIGDRVYSKEFGEGIIEDIFGIIYKIHFFGASIMPTLEREELFTRGDKVQIVNYNRDWSTYPDPFEFYAFLDHNPNSKKKFTVTGRENSIHYVYDVRHAKEYQRYLTDDLQIDITKRTCRPELRDCKNYDPDIVRSRDVYKIDKGKELLKIKCMQMELDARIKEYDK